MASAKFCAVVVCLTLGASSAFGGPATEINEIRIDQDGADNDEYFELAGDPGASLDGLFYIVIGDGAGGSGTIEEVTDLLGMAISGDGFFVAAESTFTLGVADLVTSLNFENSDNVTHMLVSGFTGADGDDLDTDDDCVLDIMPWDSVVDSVSLIGTVDEEDCFYSTNTVGPDGDFVPGHVYRCDREGDWLIGAFDVFDGTDTPGAVNLNCDAVCGLPDAGSCFEANGTPGCDDGECCEMVCAVDPQCCDVEWDDACAATANDLCLAGGDAPDITLSEIRIDEPGDDLNEYAEITGKPGTSLDGVTYLVIGDGAGDSGTVEAAVDLSGNVIGESGHWVVAETTFNLGEADFTASLNFENSDNVTHMLIFNFTGANGEDLDTDDDCVLDLMPWDSVIDSVALVETPDEGDCIYAKDTVGPEGDFVPGHVYRCDPDGDWLIGLFDPLGGLDTPGSPNAACDEVCGVAGTGSCFEANGTPGCEDGDCCTMVCAVDPSCCEVEWDEACAVQANDICLAGGDAPDVIINEIRIDEPGTDVNEYFELAGKPGTSLDGVTYIVIGDGADGSGVLEAVIDLNGFSIPDSGFFVAAEETFTLGVADLTINLNFENSDNVTHMVVFNLTGANGDDLDTDDDCALDVTPWEEVIDSVSLVGNDKEEDCFYAEPVGPDDIFVPGHVFRCDEKGSWTIGAFDTEGGDDTPGAPCTDCPWDLDGSGDVGTSDLIQLLGAWGTNPGGPPDFDGNGNVGTEDLIVLLGNWGRCRE